MLSDFCRKIADEYEIKVGDVKQFIPNLGSKIHRVLKFKQFEWMKKYIDFNIKKGQMPLIVLKKKLN